MICILFGPQSEHPRSRGEQHLSMPAQVGGSYDPCYYFIFWLISIIFLATNVCMSGDRVVYFST